MVQGRFKLQGTLAVIGGGRMGEAIVSGLLDCRARVEPCDVIVAEPVAERRVTLDAAHGVSCDRLPQPRLPAKATSSSSRSSRR